MKHETYTVKQVADILGYSTNSIYTFLKEKRIKGVRVGRGRFRIPQTEVDRLLLHKSQNSQDGRSLVVASTSLQPSPLNQSDSGIVEAAHAQMLTSDFSSTLSFQMPSLFDWFVGLSSILLGASMVLFSGKFDEFFLFSFSSWDVPLAVSLITAGVGILLSDIVGKKTGRWHKIFQAIEMVCYLASASIMWASGHVDGVVLYGMMVAVLALSFIFPLGGIANFSLYVAGVMVLLPLSLILFPQNAPAFFTHNGSPWLIASIWVVLSLITAVLSTIGYLRSRIVFWISTSFFAVLLLVLSLWYANSLFWGRSLFLLMISIITLSVPTWHSMRLVTSRERRMVFFGYGSVLVLFLAIIGVIRLFQDSILGFASNRLKDKMSYGKVVLESAFDSVRTMLESSAQNSVFSERLQVLVDPIKIPKSSTAIGNSAKDKDTVTSVLRGMFDGNKLIRYVLFAKNDGTVIATYPYDPEREKTSIGSRSYVLQTLTKKQTVISEKAESDAVSGQNTVVVITPVFSKSRTISGVLVAGLDMVALGGKLERVAEDTAGEFFVVVDRDAVVMVDKDVQTVGKGIRTDSSIRKGLLGEAGVMQEYYGNKNERVLSVYDRVGLMGWGISLSVGVEHVLRVANAPSMVIFAVIGLSVVLLSLFLGIPRKRTDIPMEDTS